MSKVELRQVVGKHRTSRGQVQTLGWNMDILMLDGVQIATINRVPGAPVGLMSHVTLTPSQRADVEAAVASARGGVKPAKISGPIVPYEILEDEETDLDEASNE